MVKSVDKRDFSRFLNKKAEAVRKKTNNKTKNDLKWDVTSSLKTLGWKLNKTGNLSENKEFMKVAI